MLPRNPPTILIWMRKMILYSFEVRHRLEHISILLLLHILVLLQEHPDGVGFLKLSFGGLINLVD
jgi:hypothetical protein